MQVDYLILGQGICGTMLSYHLLKEGASVMVIDENNPHTASRVASGLMNPVTGKRYVQSWMAEQLMPFAEITYKALETELNASLITPGDVLNFFPDPQARGHFISRIKESVYLKMMEDEACWQPYFRFSYGIGMTSPCRLADLHTLLEKWRSYLTGKNFLLETFFDWKDCTVLPDKIIYKDITARKIICCEGTGGYTNPYFSRLPYTQSKGELLIASIPELPRTNIFQQGIKITPWQDDLFWIGSSFEWKFTDTNPTEKFRRQVETHLKYWLKLPYEITDHIAATRPVTVEYKPFTGIHPLHPAVGLLNGMGTKGCSLAPWFAKQLADYLLYKKPLLPEADVARFSRILSK